MDEFPSNSHTGQEKEGPKRQGPAPKGKLPKEVKQVVTGKVVRRKKPLGTRFKETFFSGDGTRGVWGYVMGEVLVPAAKDMIVDATRNGVERAVFGESQRGPRGWRPGNSPSGHTRYDGYSRPSNTPPWRGSQPAQREISSRGRSQHNFDEIILDSRGEAEQVIDVLIDIVNEYGQATVADLYELVGITSAYTDPKYGWTSMQGAGVQHIRGGQYLLNLPKPQPLD
jgi:hypothetical protein